VGSDAGGERAAAIYSLVGTAKLNGIDPQAYLRHVLERIADHPINAVEELLPWHGAAADILTIDHDDFETYRWQANANFPRRSRS
jgi:hypothetical protein